MLTLGFRTESPRDPPFSTPKLMSKLNLGLGPYLEIENSSILVQA